MDVSFIGGFRACASDFELQVASSGATTIDKMTKAIFAYDISCPWAYIASKRITAYAIANFGGKGTRFSHLLTSIKLNGVQCYSEGFMTPLERNKEKRVRRRRCVLS